MKFCSLSNKMHAVFVCCLVAGAAASFFENRQVHLQGELGRDSAGHIVLPSEGQAPKLGQDAKFIQLSLTGRMTSKLHEWLHPLSAAAVVTTIALQLSPMPSSLEINRDRDVKRYDGYPYFAVLAGATQWCFYGSYAAMATHDMNLLTMVAANAPGMFFGVFYVTNFFRFVSQQDPRNAALKRFLSVGAVILLAEIAGCIMLGRGAVFFLGLLGAIGSAQIAISPFKTLPEVLRNRSTKSWPLDLCVWNLIQSWFTGGFGLANNDPWVWAPNLIGVIAAVIQLSLVAAFYERSWGPHGTCVKLKAAEAYA